MENNIPMLSELLDLVDEGKLEGEWFTYYPTEGHRKDKSQWWGPRQEIVSMAKIREEKRKFYNLWKTN